MDCSTPVFPVLHCLPELAQTHIRWVGDAIQPSHHLSPPSLTLYLSQHQGLFQMSQFFASGGQSIGVSASASVLPMNIQDWFPLGLTGLISLLSKGLLTVFSSTTVQRCQFFSTQPSLWPSAHIHTWLLLLLSRLSHVRLCAMPLTAAHQAPPSLGFSRQEHWSGLPFPSPMHESEK